MSWDFELIDGPYGGVTEGPVWDGSGVLFTHIPQSKILRFDPKKGSSTVFRENTNQANGLARTKDGVIFACEGDARRVVLYKGSSACFCKEICVRATGPLTINVDVLKRKFNRW